MTTPAQELLRFIQRDHVQVEQLPWGPHEWICRPGLTDAQKLLLVRVTMPPARPRGGFLFPGWAVGLAGLL